MMPSRIALTSFWPDVAGRAQARSQSPHLSTFVDQSMSLPGARCHHSSASALMHTPAQASHGDRSEVSIGRARPMRSRQITRTVLSSNVAREFFVGPIYVTLGGDSASIWQPSTNSVRLRTGRVPRSWPLEGSAYMPITSRISGGNFLAGLIHNLAIVNYFKEEWTTELT